MFFCVFVDVFFFLFVCFCLHDLSGASTFQELWGFVRISEHLHPAHHKQMNEVSLLLLFVVVRVFLLRLMLLYVKQSNDDDNNKV